MSGRRKVFPISRPRGFTLIEVMIAVLVLALGLLGFALLPTMSVRFAQSANYRTQATNLAYDLLDQMRANRMFAAQYTAASFVGEAGMGGNCVWPVGNDAVPVAANVARWECEVVEALGEDSSAVVGFQNGVVSIVLTWNDARADPDNLNPNTSFVVETWL